MKQCNRLFKLICLLLVVGLLFAGLPTGQVLAQTQPYDPNTAIQLAANEIINSQAARGDWGSANAPVPDTLGVIGSGLTDAYARTKDSGHLASIQKAAAYLLTKTNNFSPADGMFAAKLDALLGGTAYKDFVKSNFFDRLTAGTYGASGNVNTARYIATLNSYLNAQDPALGLISAHLCGADTSLWAAEVKADLNIVNLYENYSPFFDAAKGIYSLAFVGETFDPTGGSFTATTDLAGMAAQLATYQQSEGGYPKDTANIDLNIQATASVTLALDQVNSFLYKSRIQNAANWLLTVQNVAGYWTFFGEESYVSTSVSLQAVNEAFPAVPAEVFCTTSCYVSRSGSDTAMGNKASPFLTIQKGINTVTLGGTVNVAAGTYTEQLNVARAVTILGPNAAITGNGTRLDEAVLTFPDGLTGKGESLLTVASDDVTISGLKFEDKTYLQALFPVHIYTLSANYLTIKNNLFIGGDIPIYRDPYVNPINPDNTGWLIENNKMVGGPFVNSSLACGMYIYKTGATIQNNIIEGYAVGIQILPANAAVGGVVENNSIAAGHIGLYHNGHDKGAGAWSYSGNTITVAPNDRSAQALYSPILPDAALNFRAIQITNFGNGGTGALPTVTFSNIVANIQPEAGSLLVDRIAIRLNLVSAAGTTVSFDKNSFVNYTVGVKNETVTAVDASPNWWGSALGPQGPVTGDVQVIQWCADADCTTFAPNAQGIIELSGPYSVPGGIQINVPGLKYHLAAGTVIQNASPCFSINTNDVFIDAEIGAKCLPTGTSNGIDVAAGLSGIRIVGLEFDGAAQESTSTGSGVVIAGAVDHFQMLNNYMHDLKGSGIVFTGAPTNNDGVAGNLFKNLGAAAIIVPAGLDPDLDAQYNSWGSMMAPTLTDVDTSNNTHVALRIVTSGTFLPDKLAIGQTIVATVVADLSNVTGADFTLTYPTNLLEIQSIENLSGMTLNRSLTDDAATGKLRFDASVPLAEPIVPVTQTGKEMFKVTFVAKAAGNATLALDELTDLFAMSPSSGYSNHVYAFELVDKPESILIADDNDTPILKNWLPLKGSTLYLNAAKQLELVIDASDSHLYELELDHSLEADTDLPKFSVYADATNPYGTLADKTLLQAAGVLVTYEPNNQVWTINFSSDVTNRIIDDHGGLMTFYAVLKDEFGKIWGSMSPTIVDNTFAYTIVRDVTAPVVEAWTPAEGQVILTPTGDFVLTVDALDAYLYSLEIDPNLEGTLSKFTVYARASDPTGGQAATFTAAGVSVAYNETTQTWTITFLNGGTALNTILANKGITFYEVLHDMADNNQGSMDLTTDVNTFAYQIFKQQPIVWDPSHTGGALMLTVSADGNTINFTGPIAWYPADPALGRTSGNRVGVEIKAPYLGFDTTASKLTFDGTTYNWDDVNDGDNFVWVYPKVTAIPQAFTITVNWSTTVSQVFTVNVLETSTLVAPTGFTVQGTISMQGRVYRGDVPINLDGDGADDYAITSQDKLGINYTSNLVLGSYTFATNQDRYLNVTATMGKTVVVNGSKTLTTLQLRGGNVDNTDNANPDLSSKDKVDLSDAILVGTDYGKTGDPLVILSDANFDGRVNIQDLALVGGNYNLTSADAYADWTAIAP